MSRTPHLLVVDDDPACLKAVSHVLRREGYAITEACDGEAAWDLFLRPPGSFLFDLVITDIRMPRMDGLTLAGRIRRADPKIPVVVVSTLDDREMTRAALRAGIREYLDKPVNLMDLRECVSRLLEESETQSRGREAQTAQAVRRAQRTIMGRTDGECPLHFCYQPFSDAGGDVFRHYKRPDGSYFFMLADVAGHCVESSYAVASFLGTLSLHCWRDTPLTKVMEELNSCVCHGPFSEYPVCALLGEWQPRTGRLYMVNAGIPHGLLYERQARRARPMELDGTPLGYFKTSNYEERVCLLHPGDRVLLATDGYIDRFVRGEGSYCGECAAQSWAACRHVTIEDAIRSMRDRVDLCADEGLDDDFLLVGFEQGNLSVATDEFFCLLPSTAIAIDAGCEYLDEYIRNAPSSDGITGACRFDVVLAVREALNNAMMHGNKDLCSGEIVLHARWSAPGTLTVRVQDSAEGKSPSAGFNFDTYRPPSDPLRERGRGIPIMCSIANRIHMIPGEVEMVFTGRGEVNERNGVTVRND